MVVRPTIRAAGNRDVVGVASGIQEGVVRISSLSRAEARQPGPRAGREGGDLPMVFYALGVRWLKRKKRRNEEGYEEGNEGQKLPPVGELKIAVAGLPTHRAMRADWLRLTTPEGVALARGEAAARRPSVLDTWEMY